MPRAVTPWSVATGAAPRLRLEGVRITPAELGPDLLMIGAAALAFEPLLTDPASLSR